MTEFVENSFSLKAIVLALFFYLLVVVFVLVELFLFFQGMFVEFCFGVVVVLMIFVFVKVYLEGKGELSKNG